MKKFINLSTFYLVLGLLLGIFYREATKFNNYTDPTVLSSLHTHTLVLGFLFFLIVLLLDKNFNITKYKNFTIWLVMYNISFIYLLITLTLRGISEVYGKTFNGLSHIAGLGHAILGISLIWFIFIVRKSIK